MAAHVSENSLELIDVSKKFSTSGLVLNQINLKIQKGDFVVILGPSGSGKSTLLRLIAGLDESSSGRIKRDEKKSFVFQDASLMPWRDLIANVSLPLELAQVSQEEILAKANAALESVQLSDAKNLFPHELSGGMKMRASLARALISNPDLLLLDEPFAALDEQTRFKMADDLRKLWLEKKMTVVFVTHSIFEACFLANRILTLSSKPAQIKHDIKINLPEIRNQNLRTEPEFNLELKRLYEVLKS